MTCFRRTPLHLATINGHLQICQLIIEYVADKNPKDFSRNTPLHLASEKGCLEICKLFAKYVNDVDIKNSFGKTPIDLAEGNKNSLVLEFLKSCKNTQKRKHIQAENSIAYEGFKKSKST